VGDAPDELYEAGNRERHRNPEAKHAEMRESCRHDIPARQGGGFFEWLR
jgi:hypothetical protein